MVRRGTGFDPDQAWRQLLEERQDVTPLQLPADDDLTFRINAVDLENRLGDVETDCRDRLHAWLLQIVGALTAHTFMALTCRWRSRPPVSYTHLRAHETPEHLVCRLLLEKKKKTTKSV